MKKILIVLLFVFILVGCDLDKDRFYERIKEDLPSVIEHLQSIKGERVEVTNIRWINIYSATNEKEAITNYYYIEYFETNDEYLLIKSYNSIEEVKVEIDNEYRSLEDMISAYEATISDAKTAVKLAKGINLLSKDENVTMEYYSNNFSKDEIIEILIERKKDYNN